MTTEKIIDAAERLFAEHGIDGVSMRRIGAAAGSGNHYAVQYHFKDKVGLARAIIAARAGSLEEKRMRLLNEAGTNGGLRDPHALMRAYLLPYALHTDKDGRHTYAAFAISLNFHSSIPDPQSISREMVPMAMHILHLLTECLPDVPIDAVRRRLRIAMVAFLHAVVEADRESQAHLTPEAQMTAWEDAIRMIATGYMAPYVP